MCRWMAYKGSPVTLNTILTYPENSIVNQAKDAKYQPGCEYQSQKIAEKRNCRVNADGFGVAWYTKNLEDYESCVFRSTMPSWGDPNLAEIGKSVRSPTVFAHVRAMTSPGLDPVVGSVSIQNCHPFKWKSFTFMHNGGIEHFSRIKRKLQTHMSDRFFGIIAGSTDSENIFALFLSILERNLLKKKSPGSTSNPESGSGGRSRTPERRRKKMGNLPPPLLDASVLDRKRGVKISDEDMLNAEPKEIAKALQRTIQFIVDTIVDISTFSACSLNLAVTNGTWMLATRFRRGKSEAPSLYFAMLEQIEGQGGSLKLWAQDNTVEETVKELHAKCIVVSSEPLTMDPCWNLVADSTMIVVHGDPKDRSIAGRVELIPLKLDKCSRKRKTVYTCCPGKALRTRSLDGLYPSKVDSKFMDSPRSIPVRDGIESVNTSSTSLTTEREDVPPLLLTAYTEPLNRGMASRGSTNRMSALIEANEVQSKKAARKKEETCMMTAWRQYIEPSLLAGVGLAIVRRDLFVSLRKYPRTLALSAAFLIFFGIRRRKGLNCPVTTFLFGPKGSAAENVSMTLLRKQIRSDLMWILLLLAVAK